jgi:hypothetical protein
MLFLFAFRKFIVIVIFMLNILIVDWDILVRKATDVER